VNMYGQNGNKVLNRKRGEVIWTPGLNMDADLAVNRWHGEGTSDTYPSSAGLRKGWNQKMSDYFVEDGSFFRIQNIQLGYSIKDKNLFGGNFPETKITFTADRPLTLFKYHGFSPEVANGIDSQTYPVPATYTVGLNVKF
jgi:TonB-dependent starch-binding outer membrane protein SusC